MDFTGIIAEYDPFHNGHAAQLAAVRAAGAQCIAVCMSSGAVQRGGVPILPESVRVRAALDAGADLVVALPAPYACATAEQFAAAGVHLLAALGCDTLAFGAETPDAAALLDTARLLDGEELNARIRQNLATGMTYAAARAAAADALHPGTGGLLRTPNNILGIEYCKALLRRHAACRSPIGSRSCPPARRSCTAGLRRTAFCWTAQDSRPPFWPCCGCRTPRILRRCAA